MANKAEKLYNKAQEMKAKIKAGESPITNDRCEWNPDEKGKHCSGQVAWREILDGTVLIPLCDHHYNTHCNIMLLHQYGFDDQQILDADIDWINEQALALRLAKLTK